MTHYVIYDNCTKQDTDFKLKAVQEKAKQWTKSKFSFLLDMGVLSLNILC
jgi:hypothetical protein